MRFYGSPFRGYPRSKHHVRPVRPHRAPLSRKAKSLACVLFGVALMALGGSLSPAVGADFIRFLTIAPTIGPVWLMIGGIVASGAGVVGLFRDAQDY